MILLPGAAVAAAGGIIAAISAGPTLRDKIQSLASGFDADARDTSVPHCRRRRYRDDARPRV